MRILGGFPGVDFPLLFGERDFELLLLLLLSFS